MSSICRRGAVTGALCLLVLSSCQDSGVVQPELPQDGPQPAIVDGWTDGAEGFYFLPPMSRIIPWRSGPFNPDLEPSVRVCELDGEPGTETACIPGDPVAHFGPGSVDVKWKHYRLLWDTDGPETAPLDPDRYYRLQVLIGGQVLGFVDLDPINGREPEGLFDWFFNQRQRPAGWRGQESYVYRFAIGRRIPVKFYLSGDFLCTGESFVTECISETVVGQEGGNLTIEDEGNRLGVLFAANSLPEGVDQIGVTLERLDPEAYYQATGQECIPGLTGFVPSGAFGAPQFGDCFRVTTVPALDEGLVQAAVVSICLDVTDLNLSLQQTEQLRMVKYSDEGEDPEWTALQETFGDCPEIEGSLFDVPERGFMRYAALGANALAGLVLPQPVEARNIRFGGFNSSFSRFRFALPGQMVATEGDGTIIQPAGQNTIPATIQVLDAGNDDGENRQPVAGARVRFEPTDGAGTVSASEVVTDAQGNATVEWTVDVSEPGEKVLVASSLGLVAGPVPDPDGGEHEFVAESVEITATVVGPPAGLVPSQGAGSAPVASEVNLSITVLDAGGLPIANEPLQWSVVDGNGSIVGADGQTDEEGMGSATLVLGASPGINRAQVSAGGLTQTFEVEGQCSALGTPDAIDGIFDAGWACAASEKFTAEVPGSYGFAPVRQTPSGFVSVLAAPVEQREAVVYWMNDEDNLYVAVRVRVDRLAQKSLLRLDFDNDGDGRSEVGDDAIWTDAYSLFDHFTDDPSCLLREAFFCGKEDQKAGGSVGTANDGVWTTFEFSRPLQGDAEDIMRAPGDALGFYLSLRQDGVDTQYPGPQQYIGIVIQPGA